MSAQTVETHERGDVHTHEHPSDKKYVEIALILGLITAAEVATYFVDIGDALIPTLMVMMVAKFFMVGAWFMHLKFDFRLYTRMFVAGLVLAVAVYIAMLTAFEFWVDG